MSRFLVFGQAVVFECDDLTQGRRLASHALVQAAANIDHMPVVHAALQRAG